MACLLLPKIDGRVMMDTNRKLGMSCDKQMTNTLRKLQHSDVEPGKILESSEYVPLDQSPEITRKNGDVKYKNKLFTMLFEGGNRTIKLMNRKNGCTLPLTDLLGQVLEELDLDTSGCFGEQKGDNVANINEALENALDEMKNNILDDDWMARSNMERHRKAAVCCGVVPVHNETESFLICSNSPNEIHHHYHDSYTWLEAVKDKNKEQGETLKESPKQKYKNTFQFPPHPYMENCVLGKKGYV
ncbi:unnamed protein product [Owenia fusiformis]|uniref:Uncharacterized protein n=1 Tax=Owenia fusiformis TaxID=6347 RepID=A0A8S4MVD9_OWEFU|nr:unnamed protein product [Owenia fusiformis]